MSKSAFLKIFASEDCETLTIEDFGSVAKTNIDTHRGFENPYAPIEDLRKVKIEGTWEIPHLKGFLHVAKCAVRE